MIENRGRGLINVYCDECEWDGNVGFETFRDALKWIKDSNWLCKKDYDGEWAHYCPQCAEKLGLRKPFCSEKMEEIKHEPLHIILRRSDGYEKPVDESKISTEPLGFLERKLKNNESR